MPVSSWSTTASSNATADSASGINWAEGMSPAQVNDSARAMMAVIKGDFGNSLAASGYQKFPNGLIIQWGLASSGGSTADTTVTFPMAFPVSCYTCVAVPIAAVGTGELQSRHIVSLTSTQVVIAKRFTTGSTPAAANQDSYWIAVGR